MPLPNFTKVHLCVHFRRFLFIAVVFLTACRATCSAQTTAENPDFARRNSFGVFGAYSGDSSHILIGQAGSRRLLDFGGSYSRRLHLNRTVNLQYDAEFLPVVLESDPLSHVVENQTSPDAQTYTYDSGPAITCSPITTPYSTVDLTTGITYSGTFTVSCYGRRWVVGEAISPAGLQLNFLPGRKLQPLIVGHGGYEYSSQAIPVDGAGNFNFTFDLGAGFEFYRTKTRSIRVEYRYHHISNGFTASQNPGIDNGLFQVTYAFGR
jgi:opacity protein-like surface antigen